MSGGFDAPGSGGSGGMETNGFQSLLDQLRRTSNQGESPQGQSQRPQQHQHQHVDLLSHFGPFQSQPASYYDQQHSESPDVPDSLSASMASHLPAAPTPPSGASFPNAPFPPAMLGSIGSGRPTASQANASHLLNLLKFSGPGSQAPVHPASVPQEAASREQDHRQSVPLASTLIHAPAPAPSDPTGLLAALMKGSLKDEPPKPEPEPEPAAANWATTSQTSETQQYLLNLLNRPKPSQNDAPYSGSSKSISMTPQSASERSNDHGRDFSSLQEALSGMHHEVSPLPAVPVSAFDFESPKPNFEEEKPSSKLSPFGYNNPFDDRASTSPLNRTPKSSTTPGASGAAASAVDYAEGGKRRRLSPLPTAGHSRRHAERAPSSDSPLKNSTPIASAGANSSGDKARETVAEAVNELANKADKEAQEALARAEAEHAQAEIAKDMENLILARTDAEFEEAARVAGQAIKKELDKEENQDVLEKTLPLELAKAVRDTVDEAAHGPVADSWESAEAEADEIVVIEEAVAPVKVYNFPMKPWVSITVQDDDKEERPVFQDSSILDIARLKKDFDQIDRNLVTATEGYIGYGMSKAGGLRVIRQLDGKDAKLFTDTKDRIFNVAMSSVAASASSVQKDAIIGTGLSGTVYWVQIRDGAMDHLDDAHPEQYGFALPPVSSGEGDVPGGVLKTRARTSTNHTEYFAVGRGKFINIVWPGFIMQNNLFKPGHDRVVDTERLSKLCSLKINTGKAGKDFTFSQDDTVVVSLDKSGRVKFWDVRDLTAAKDVADGRNPMPARTSLEVKEPLMTLTTTPEGEKAWPTSVLLLDKLRPYQKQCALRYMIVGMKQNHTLQLWDLGLGKPVQELNLPHSKESDAVCSVMYHPPTGMVVVGHPTRNSIYFLHLSAPKYAMKSLSQVDYIQRLTAQDSSIPQPESTAVISGIREYSFANRGSLRSLDMLSDPAKGVGEEDDPALFELYAMQSRGVTCLFVRQRELGWTKDNKVIDPVDAAEAGIVKIGKLNAPLQSLSVPDRELRQPPEEPSLPVTAPRIIVSRGAGKDPQSSQSQDDAAVRKETGSLAAKAKQDAKEDDVSVPHPGPSTDKPEKRSRKKKAAAAAAAAAAAQAAASLATDNPRDAPAGGSNGSSHSPRITPAKTAENVKTILSPPVSTISQEGIDTAIGAMEARICERVSGSIHVAFDDIKKDINTQFRTRDTEFEQKQRRLLDMVSEVLNNNTEQVLGKIVRSELESSVIPAIRDDMSRSISDQLGNKLNQQISHVVQREVQRTLPNSVSQALKGLDLSKAVSDKVIRTVTAQFEEQLPRAVSEQVVPAFTSLTAQAVQQVALDVHQKTVDRMAQLERFQEVQNDKIDGLMVLITRLTETVSTMATAQTQYQDQMLKVQASHAAKQKQPVPSQQQQQHSARVFETASASYNSPSGGYSYPSPHDSGVSQQLIPHRVREEQERLELQRAAATMDGLMKEGKYDEAMMHWLQSGKEEQLFKLVLINYNPDVVTKLQQPLILLSVGTTIAKELTGPLLAQKLAWIELVVLQFYPMAPYLVCIQAPSLVRHSS